MARCRLSKLLSELLHPRSAGTSFPSIFERETLYRTSDEADLLRLGTSLWWFHDAGALLLIDFFLSDRSTRVRATFDAEFERLVVANVLDPLA